MTTSPHSLAGSRVQSTLAGKRILLTGTTGYLGKVILEKLIRSVPDLQQIVLLIRGNRKYPCATERFYAEVATSTVFDHLRETRPDYLEDVFENRIRCVAGEITQRRFGLQDEEFRKLASQVDVVVNSAASVNFREALDTALTINALCLNNLADFAAIAGDIPVVQISTCYVNGYNTGTIREAVSPSASGLISHTPDGGYDIGSVFAALETRINYIRQTISEPEAQAEALTEIGQQEAHRYGWGDTYTFTKWLGEQLLLKRLKGKTLTIVRPSVIESCLTEPKPGWIEGVKVTDAILLAYARSKVSLFPGRKAGIVDIIPADLVANAVILSIAEALDKPGQSRIYQSCSGTQNPLVVRDYIRMICGEMKRNWQKYPRLTRKAPRKKFTLVNKRVFVAMIQLIRMSVTMLDRLQFRGAGNKSDRLKAVETTLKLTRIYSTYTSPEYVFNSDRLMQLSRQMGDADQALFPVDAALIDWKRYFEEIHITGLNRYGMAEPATVAAEAPAPEPAAAGVPESA